jgi:transcription elongation factor Elf1
MINLAIAKCTLCNLSVIISIQQMLRNNNYYNYQQK